MEESVYLVGSLGKEHFERLLTQRQKMGLLKSSVAVLEHVSNLE